MRSSIFRPAHARHISLRRLWPCNNLLILGLGAVWLLFAPTLAKASDLVLEATHNTSIANGWVMVERWLNAP